MFYTALSAKRATRLLLMASLLFILSACSTTVPVRPLDSTGLKPGHYEFTLRHRDRVRRYILYLPGKWRPGESLPMVVVLHSGGGNAPLIEERTGMTKKAEQEGFIVVYPYGTGYTRDRFHTWNSGHCCFYALEKSVDDIGYIRRLILMLRDRLNVDRHRIYVAGFSNGGMLAYWLGAIMPDTIAAIAPVSATIGGKPEPEEDIFRIPMPRATLPLITFHGLADQQIPFVGGKGAKSFGGRSDISVPASLAYWMKPGHCSRKAVRHVNHSGNVTRYTYKCRSSDVELYTIKGMGHAWPSETRKGWRIEYALLDKPSFEISATDLIWKFFKQHPRQQH
jgi:polyhydroxybutyrate depolymerase